MIKNLDRKWQKYISDMLKEFWILPMESEKKIKPMVEEMSDCYSTAKRLIEAADRLMNETY